MGKEHQSTTTARIEERVHSPLSGAKVDRDAGVIRGVLICGPESANRRDYLPGSFGDGRQYEGRSVYLNHANGTRQAQDKLGWFSNVRLRPNGLPEGDFNILKSHPMAASVFEAAERNPALFGMSHVAMCKTSQKNGREQIEAVQSVESVDLVSEPATTRGFYESTNKGNTVKLDKLIEWLAPKVKFAKLAEVKLLSEMDGMDGLDVPEPGEGVNADDAVKGAFVSAMHTLVDAYASGGIDGPTLLGKFKELDKSLAKLSGKAEEPKPAETPAEEMPADAAKEAKQLTDDIKAIIAEGIKAGIAELKTVAPKHEPETPVSKGREVPTEEGKTAPPADPEEFKKYIESRAK